MEVLIAHPGGPFFARREAGAWSIVKGEHDDSEDPLAAAVREFVEETGLPAPVGPFIELGEISQKGGKRVRAWAAEADLDPEDLDPGHFVMVWRGREQSFPEIDRVAWVEPGEAVRLLNPAQGALVERLLAALADR